MGFAGDTEPADPFGGDWDSAAAEEELQAIEAAYFSKRNNTHLSSSDDHPSPSRRRRLPDFHAHPTIQPSNHCRSRDVPLSNQGAEGSPAAGIFGLAPRPCRVNFKLRHPAIRFGGRIAYCRTTREVEQAALVLLDKVRDLKQNVDRVPLGFDIEWRPVFRQGEIPNKAAVMQICVDMSHCYVMHIIHSGIPPSLKSLLEDCSSVKVGVCIANDATKILRDYSVRVEPLDDLSAVANRKLGGRYKNWSLASLTEVVTCKELAKPQKIRMGNWEAYPLSKEQLEYAATDAYVSWYLYQALMSYPDWKSEEGNVEKDNNVDAEKENVENVKDVKPGSHNLEEANDVAA